MQYSGTVVTVNLERGFGFIRIDGERHDVFFHVKQIERLAFDATLVERRVQFDIEETSKGPQAVNVRPAD